MKVFVKLNQRNDGSYLLNLGQGITAKKVRKVLTQGHESAIQNLMAGCLKNSVVKPRDRGKAKQLADFVVSRDGYTSERLA